MLLSFFFSFILLDYYPLIQYNIYKREENKNPTNTSQLKGVKRRTLMLKFFYGVMGSSKTAQLLIQNYNCKKLTGAYTTLLKPSTDIRASKIKSRIGLSANCVLFTPQDDLTTLSSVFPEYILSKDVFIFVDEAQFCTPAQIDQLRRLANDQTIKVYCYGLKTNFKSELFAGSKRLLEVADEIEEISHFCNCGNKAIFNARFLNGVLQLDGAEIQIGDEEYKPLCSSCYAKAQEEARKEREKEKETG